MNVAKLEILKDTLENQFSIDRFKKFIREFFNELDILPEVRRKGIWREYDNYIRAYYTVAKYVDSQDKELMVMAVELKKHMSVDRARSMQRNFVSKVLDENNLGGALVAFYAENEPGWRLSFVRLDYSLTDKGIDLDLTPARRYSYLVGENEPNNTVQIQLLPIFEDDTYNPTLDEIENAFSVEKVTKDFFTQYKEKYLDFKEHLENNSAFIDETKKLGFEVEKFSEQFAKKLMGQLAFLYFLQKKGWLGVRIMPEDRTLTEVEFQKIYSNRDNIHKAVLDKLFKKTRDKKRRLSLKEFHKIDNHEAELLSDCFVGTAYDMPWGAGNKTFIREIFDFCIDNTSKNFFDDYLEPFLYNGLNTKRKNHYYKEFNCKIPFLNGGLFEPLEGYHWKDVNFEIPNELFSNKKEKGREAAGILDIFDRFNFTMNEDEPLEKEVAIDPEMLGKIFENLLDVKDRKSKGAFYTPREIVHYMCQESLINYLVNEVNVPYEDVKKFILYGELIKDQDNRRIVKHIKDFEENKAIPQSIYDNIGEIDDALKNVKVADPAVGSGAFPLGMLNEIIKARNNITEYIIRKDKEGAFDHRYGEAFIRKWRLPYKMKLETIKNCIFAVDIEPSAVDIAKLRLWLSVVVEQEIDDENPEPHPLPNLDMNIHVGNSLIDEYEGIKLFDESILLKSGNKTKENNAEYTGSKPMQMELFIDPTEELLEQMFELQDRYFGEEDEGRKRQLKADIDKARDEIIRHKLHLDGNEEALEKYEQSLKNKTKPYFIWELEFAKTFKEKGGFDIVIGNPPYGVKFDGKTKGYLSNRYPNVPDYESADYFVCKSYYLLKKEGLMLYIIPNTILSNLFAEKIRVELLQNWAIKSIDNLSDIGVFLSASVRNCILNLEKSPRSDFSVKFINGQILNFNYKSNDYKNISKKLLIENIDSWLNIFYQDNDIINIINKLKENSNMLGDFTEISQGLIPYDKYRGHSQETIKNRIWHASYKKDDTYKKELQGRDLERYMLRWNGQRWISYGEWLAAPRKPGFFNGKRILIREITNPRILANYVEDEYYNSPSIINVINFQGISPLYLLGILNSKLLSFYHNKTSPKANKGLFPKILINDVRKLPIRVAKENLYSLLIEKVEKIMGLLKNNMLDEAIDIDRDIDSVVCKIYEVNDREIEVIENFFREES